jgi:YVTN family beta-propeller protein
VGYCLGVDLGTTFVAAAVAYDTRVEMSGLGDRSVVMPAAVYVRDDGVLVTGDAAVRRAVSNPDRVASEVKRRLGDPTPVMVGGRSYAVTDLLGTLLADVLVRVVREQGADPDVVVLSHPANWGPYRRELFEEVAGFAGLSRARTVTEPEAAAAHHATTRRLEEGEVIAVYDLGGGTFDAAVLRRTADGMEILGSPEGIERLGGADFDEAVLSFVNHAAGGALSELDLGDPQTVVALARLRQDCVLAKEALTLDTETTIPVFLPGRHLDVPLTRAQFEDLIRAPVESTIGTLSRTLRTAQVAPDQVSAVLLVGGSAQIPLIGAMIGQELGRPTVLDAHPKYAVALGAATLARASAGAATGFALRTAPSQPRVPPAPASVPALPPSPPGVPGDRTRPVARPSFGRAPASPGAPPAPPEPGSGTAGPDDPPGTDHPGAAAPPRPPGRGTDGEPRRDAAGPSGPEPDPPGRPGRRPWLAAALLLVAITAVLGVYLFLDRVPAVGTDEPSASTGSASSAPAPPGDPVPTTAPPEVSPSVPIPSLGTTIDVGETPGFVVASPNGRQLYIANRAAGVVTVVDTAVDRVTATIRIPVGPPQYLAFSPDGRTVYVSVWDEARTVAAVSVLDTTTNTIVATTPVRTRPFVPAVTRDGERLYVPNHDSGTISLIDVATNEVLRDITVPPNPHWLEFTPDGSRAYVANHESNLISVLDATTNAVTAQVSVGTSPHSVAVHPTRPLVANVNYDADSLTMIDTNTNTVVATVPVGRNPQDVTWAADGRFAYVANVGDDTVSVVGVDTASVTATLPTGGSPTSIAVLPDGTRAYVTNLRSGTLTVLDLTG